MNRIDTIKSAIKKARNDDELKGVLAVLLIDYSHNIISRMQKPNIIEWLEEEVKA